MRILALCHGTYGDRIVRHITEKNDRGWQIEVMKLPTRLPLVIDEPEEFLPSEVPPADLVLAMGQSAESAQLLPAIVRLSGARAAIVPNDSSAWLPSGLKNQVREEILKTGVTAVFPKTFCTLTETACGYGSGTETYRDDLVAEFAGRFGRPGLEVKLDGEGRIATVDVLRSAPCGSTHLVAERLKGVPVTEAVPQAGLYAHHFPCLASMSMEPDGGTLMLISGYVVNEEVEARLGLLRSR